MWTVCLCFFCLIFFFNDTATTEIYTLSLHDALPIARTSRGTSCRAAVPTVTGTDSFAGARTCLFAQPGAAEIAAPSRARRKIPFENLFMDFLCFLSLP